MDEKLLIKIETEMKEFKNHIKEMGVDYAIEKAYELTTKQEIIDCLQYDNTLSKTEIKSLLSRENILNEMYDDWLSFDGNMREDLVYSVDKSLRIIKNDYIKSKEKIEKNER